MRVEALIQWYYDSRSFKTLKPNSVRQYKHLLKKASPFLRLSTDVNRIKALEADSIYDDLSSHFGTHCAVSTCRILNHIWKLGIRYEKTERNPFSLMEHPPLNVREVLWDEQSLKQFIITCKKNGYYSLGLLALFCYVFAQRPGDMRRLTNENIEGSSLSFRQEKTNTELVLFIPSFVLMEIQAFDNYEIQNYGSNRKTGRDNYAKFLFINPDTSKPYTERDYNKIAFDMKRKAGLPIELQIRDLRKSALTSAASIADDSLLKRLGGHKSDSSLAIYRRSRAKQTEAVQNKRFRNSTLTRV